jgi:hypothetical protein
MRVTIHQPEHLPWLGFIDKARRADQLVLLDDVQFRKNYFQNRNRIRSADGSEWVTVPVLTKGRSTDEIRQIEINNAGAPRWRQKYWLTIEQRYRTAPFWRSYAPPLQTIFEREWPLLAELNIELIRLLFSFFDVRANVVRSSSFGVTGEKSERLLRVCQAAGASEYLSGVSGREYLDLASFDRAGIAVSFQEFHHPIYRQLYEPFVPLLSCIDLLFMHGPESGAILDGIGVETIAEIFT